MILNEGNKVRVLFSLIEGKVLSVDYDSPTVYVKLEIKGTNSISEYPMHTLVKVGSYNPRYEVPIEISEKALEQVNKVEYEMLLIKRQSCHPQDNYLFLVLAKNPKNDTYVVWDYNSSLNSLNIGRYCGTRELAMEEWDKAERKSLFDGTGL